MQLLLRTRQKVAGAMRRFIDHYSARQKFTSTNMLNRVPDTRLVRLKPTPYAFGSKSV